MGRRTFIGKIKKERVTMFDIAEFIVGLLFLPVTVFILIPLAMLIGRTIASIFRSGPKA